MAGTHTISSMNPSDYRFDAVLMDGNMKMEFLLDYGVSRTMDFYNMYFEGQQYMDNEFHYVTIGLTNKEGVPQPNVHILLAIPLVRSSTQLTGSLIQETKMKQVIAKLKQQPSTKLGLILPSFYILNEKDSKVSISMCLNETYASSPTVFSHTAYTVVINSVFHYFQIDGDSETIVFKKRVNNAIEKKELCSGLPETLELYNEVGSEVALPSFTIPTMHSFLQNSKTPFALGLLTSTSLFPMITNADLGFISRANQNNPIQRNVLKGTDLTKFMKYLTTKGITSENYFITRDQKVKHPKFQSILEQHSFKLVELDTEKPKKEVKQTSGTFMPIKHESSSTDLLLIIHNNLTLVFEWLHKFTPETHKMDFHSQSLTSSTKIQYYLYQDEVKYAKLQSYYAVTLPILLPRVNAMEGRGTGPFTLTKIGISKAVFVRPNTKHLLETTTPTLHSTDFVLTCISTSLPCRIEWHRLALPFLDEFGACFVFH